MAQAWQTLERIRSADGELALLRRGVSDFLIELDGRVLMNSRANRSELALAELACSDLTAKAPRVLIGGLGMGCSLRAALDVLPSDARVVVAELHQTIAGWCAGPLAEVNGDALADPRVELKITDVARLIRSVAETPEQPRFDAIVLDLFEGPHGGVRVDSDPFYGSAALARTRRALAKSGCFSVWSEDPDAGFEKRLVGAGFRFERRRPGRGGRRHAVYLATPAS